MITLIFGKTIHSKMAQMTTIALNFTIYFAFIFTLTLTAKENGVCYIWSEGDSQGLIECKSSSLEDCSKGNKPITKNDTAFQNYTGKLFRNEQGQSIHEFKTGSADICDKEFIKEARESELTMCDNWGKAVYSTGLKVGDNAFVYGKSVNVRESANNKSKKLFSSSDRTKVKILEKSAKEDKIDKLYSAYWFKVSIDGKTGWIYGQFLHPNPMSKTEFIE